MPRLLALVSRVSHWSSGQKHMGCPSLWRPLSRVRHCFSCCRDYPARASAFVLTLFPLLNIMPSLRWAGDFQKNLTHISWISSVGRSQRKDRFLPSWSFHFRWATRVKYANLYCIVLDGVVVKKSNRALQGWGCGLCFFPMWLRGSRERVLNYSLSDTCVCCPLPPCVWCFLRRVGTERVECLFYLLLFFVWADGLLVLSCHSDRLPGSGKGRGGWQSVHVWLLFIRKPRELQPACVPGRSTPSDSFLPVTPPASEVHPSQSLS